ncbi:hypothetical protein KKA09_02795 [Patescibacteria group bacterium]|nr:hypothetical protein [Patescibacteria group bacterium]
METLTQNQKIEYQNIFRTQNIILEELKQLKIKMMILGSLGRFENLTKKGKEFAKRKGIKLSDVLKND